MWSFRSAHSISSKQNENVTCRELIRLMGNNLFHFNDLCPFAPITFAKDFRQERVRCAVDSRNSIHELLLLFWGSRTQIIPTLF
jgi:hypothetical protein